MPKSDMSKKKLLLIVLGLVTLGLVLAIVFFALRSEDDKDVTALPTKVSGIVIIDGEPVVDAFVQVAPWNGDAAQGFTDKDGRFTLGTNTADDGCVAGTHPVAIIARDFTDDEVILRVPKAYQDLRTTPERVTISDSPTDILRIELTWDGVEGPVRESLE